MCTVVLKAKKYMVHLFNNWQPIKVKAGSYYYHEL